MEELGAIVKTSLCEGVLILNDNVNDVNMNEVESFSRIQNLNIGSWSGFLVSALNHNYFGVF